MKLLLVPAFLGHHGGFENFVQALADVAVEAGHQVRIVTAHRVQRDATIYAGLGAIVPFASAHDSWRATPFGGIRYGLGRAWHVARTGRSLTAAEDAAVSRDRVKPFIKTFWQESGAEHTRWADVVHLIGKPKRFLLDAARAAVAARKPVLYSEVAQVTGDYVARHDHQEFVADCNVCDRFHVYGHSQVADVRRHFGYAGDVRVVDQWAYQHESRLLAIDPRKSSSQEAPLVCGSLSRLSPEKGLPTLFGALAEARVREPRLRLQLAGAGPLGSALERAARELGVADAVTFRGFTDDPVDFYRSIDVFIIASDEEGGPITGVEAMAAGLPIISTPVGVMPERLPAGTGAISVTAGSIPALRDAMLCIASDASLRQRLGQVARNRYFERNHSRALKSDTLDLWQSIRPSIGRGSRRRQADFSPALQIADARPTKNVSSPD